MITAKLYLMEMCGMSEKDLTYIEKFWTYTLEAIMIHVLGSVFNCVQNLPAVRVSTLSAAMHRLGTMYSIGITASTP